MKKLFPLLFFALIVQFSFAQKSSWLTDYYPAINRAEMAVVAENYADALREYQSAFAAVPNGFARDYHNAALCALYANQPGPAFGFFEKMADKGVTMEYFSKPVFAPLHAAPGWENFQRTYDRFHQRHLATTDLAYRRELTEMADQDQLFRAMEGSYAVYGDTIRAIDSLNIQRFLHLLAVKGFPSEERIGADFPGEQIFGIVLHHHAQHLSQPAKYPGWPDLAPDLVAAAQTGDIEPRQAAFFLEMQNEPGYRFGAFGLIGLVIDGAKQPEWYLDLPADRETTDQMRAALGLEPLADYQAKCVFRLRHPETPFRLDDGHPYNLFELDEASATGFRKVLTRVETD